MKNTELLFQNRVTLHRIVDPISESNCFLLEEKGHVLVIDPNQPEIGNWIHERKLVPDCILLTHEHCDHIGGLNQLRKQYPVPVICTEACSENIQNQRMNMSSMMELYVYYHSGKVITYLPFTCAKAEDTFLENKEWKWRECCLKGTAVPGHTRGSSLYQVEREGESILFTGDYLIQGEKIITRLQAGDPEGYQNKGRFLLMEIPKGMHIYPGHGEDYLLDNQGILLDKEEENR